MAYEGKRSAGVKKKGALLLVVVGILLLLIAGGLIWFFAAGRTPKKIENTQQEVVLEDDVIQTPFGELAYPGMWTDKVAHEITEEGEDFRVVFRSTLKDAEAELFTLCYGAVPEGGYVMGEQDGVTISVVMSSLSPEDAPDEDTLNTLYALQESVNDLLTQLREDPACIPA